MLSAKLTEGIRTSHIPEHFEICNKSPPSFSSKMPPPLIMRSMIRGGFYTAALCTLPALRERHDGLKQIPVDLDAERAALQLGQALRDGQAEAAALRMA